ncbi:MAG: hypothetical protein IJY91_00515 [Oscillospiraceae bacterium]|nr:hypothetical protein [Oscillospiraceae bacterium]
MAKKNSFFGRFRIVIRRSPLLLKCAVLAALVVSVAALTVIRVNIQQAKAQTEAARVQAAQTERENQKLDTLIQQKDTVEGSKNIAKEKLGLVDQDTTFYHIVENQD